MINNPESIITSTPDKYQAMMDSYISILEKTNSQLNLWYNPYAILIGVLAILFTILTIVAVIIIYRQGQDYRNKIQEDRDEFKKKMEQLLKVYESAIKERTEKVEKIDKTYEDLLSQYKNKLEKASKEQKDDIQKMIDKLQSEKDTLQANLGPITITPDYSNQYFSENGVSGILNPSKYHICSNCGYGYFVNDNPFVISLVHLGTKTVTCPKCRNVEKI